MLIFLLLLFCTWISSPPINTTTKHDQKPGGFATGNPAPKQSYFGPRTKEFLWFLVCAVEKRSLLWPAKRSGVKLFLPKRRVCSWNVIRNCPLGPQIVLRWRWIESWNVEVYLRLSYMPWCVAWVAMCFVCLGILAATCKAHLVTASVQMVCDTVVLSGHINDRSTTSIIMGEKEIWMTSL